MEFQKEFTEAAQRAILEKLGNGTWEQLPWLARHVKDVIGASVTTMLVSTPSGVESNLKSQFVDYHGYEVSADSGTTNCTARVIETPAVEHSHDVINRTDSAPVPKWGDSSSGISAEWQSDVYPGSFKSEDFSWQDGYPFKIMVTLRNKSQGKGYCIHYEERPSYEEFDRHFQLARDRTHNVFIRQADGSSSWDITEEMLTRPVPQETFTATDEWPEGKTHRIKFHDQRTSGLNYIYFDYKPSGIILKRYHNTKGFAVVQPRPEGV